MRRGPNRKFAAIPALLRRGGRSPSVIVGGGGGVAPTITVAPVLTWTVEIGESPTLTDPVYTGDPGTITWTLYRDGVADGAIVNVDKATAEAYAAQWSGTNTGINDIANAGGVVPLVFRATVTNGSGSDSADSNAVSFADATYLSGRSIAAAVGTLTLADGDTTVDAWESDWGGVAVTATATGASARPAYSATGGIGGRPQITFDGSSDRLTGAVTKGSAWTSVEIGVAMTASSVTNGDYPIEWFDSTTRLVQVTGGVQRANILGSGNVTSTALISTSVPQHWSADGAGSGGTVTLRLAGASEGTPSTSAAASIADGSTLGVGARGLAASGYVAGDIHGWHVGSQMTADQRLHARALLTGLTGAAC